MSDWVCLAIHIVILKELEEGETDLGHIQLQCCDTRLRKMKVHRYRDLRLCVCV